MRNDCSDAERERPFLAPRQRILAARSGPEPNGPDRKRHVSEHSNLLEPQHSDYPGVRGSVFSRRRRQLDRVRVVVSVAAPQVADIADDTPSGGGRFDRDVCHDTDRGELLIYYIY